MPLAGLLATVRSEHQRALLERAFHSGDISHLPDGALGSEVPRDVQAALEAIHPHYMGGSYLPPFRRSEVEIARVILRSTTLDVISLRAAPHRKGIRYRMVDEYPEQGRWYFEPVTSDLPLTFADLVEGLLLATCSSIDFGGLLSLQEEDDDEQFLNFRSAFYPQLRELFESALQVFPYGNNELVVQSSYGALPQTAAIRTPG